MSAQPAQDYSREAEQSFLGALLLEAGAHWRTLGRITAEDFYSREHRLIYNAIRDEIEENGTADAITVADRLKRNGEETPSGGLAYVGSLANNTPSAANIAAYAGIVRDHAMRRRAKLALHNAIAQLDEQPIEQAITATMTSLQNLAHNGTEDVPFSAALDQAMTDAEAAMKRRASGTMLGCSTTFPTLDRLTGGLHGSKMIVLGGRPGTYKSAIAWQILLRAASRGTPVGIVSLEMNHTELASRALAHELKIDGHAFVSGDRRVVEEVQHRQDPDMRQWPIRIDSRSTKLGQIMARIIEWKYRYDIQLACLDHIQLVAHEKSQNRFLELSEVSRQMKLLAMRLDIPILVLSQLSRDVEKENRRPRDSDLRECGNLEQDADIIVFTHCEKGKGIEEDRYELILSKQRGGAARQIIDLVANGEHFFVGESA